ncbi:MAG: hypothetical protein IJQ89_03600 [Bacteroidales bacterium]|nr:hypothetical protein [Bacteroidales bacterium]
MRCLHHVQGFTPRAGAYAACLWYATPTGLVCATLKSVGLIYHRQAA